MNISHIRITPLRLTTRVPYVWSQGVESAFTVNLIEIEAEDGTIGYGETTTAPDAEAQKLVLEKLSRSFIGRSVFDVARWRDEAYRGNFLVFGGNMPRHANQLFCGFEMAALDLQGKLLGRPVWDLLGGERRSDVGYFYFLQGQTADELASDAVAAVEAGQPVLYLKVGLGAERDLENVKAVRDAVGMSHRLRLDANEAWTPATAMPMIRSLAPYAIEYIEQPTASASLTALKAVKDRSPIAIGVDQGVFTLSDVYQACSSMAADMIAVGPREIGGLQATVRAAAIAEAAGLPLCIHSSMTTGITTCAEHHIGRAIPNLDDANQIMWQLLEDNIVDEPTLTPKRGKLALEPKPGLGFTLNHDVVAKAAARHRDFMTAQA